LPITHKALGTETAGVVNLRGDPLRDPAIPFLGS
jgi:hypothetical protein